jgi:septum formation protein
LSRPPSPPLVLASASPRRAEILRMLGLSPVVSPTHVHEELLPGEGPEEHVLRLAEQKAAKGHVAHPEALVLAGDTAVVLDDLILGKPADPDQATSMLLMLQGRTHRVMTGLALALPGGDVLSGVQTTAVTFRRFGEAEARDYVSTGEPMDKAGAYGIQGMGAALVERFDGDYFNVVGLPVPLLIGLFRDAGWAYGFGRLEPLSSDS